MGEYVTVEAGGGRRRGGGGRADEVGHLASHDMTWHDMTCIKRQRKRGPMSGVRDLVYF